MFTKIDKTPKTHRHRQIKEAMKAIADIVDVKTTKPFVYSSISGEGKKSLWNVILEFAGLENP